MSEENDKSKSDDSKTSAPNLNVSKQEKPDEWTMPAPVFRVSEGESIHNLPKRSPSYNQNDAGWHDKVTPNYNFSDFSPPYPYDAASPNQKPILINQSAAVRKSEKAANSKLIYALGGSILMLFFALVLLAGVYFLFLRKP